MFENLMLGMTQKEVSLEDLEEPIFPNYYPVALFTVKNKDYNLILLHKLIKE